MVRSYIHPLFFSVDSLPLPGNSTCVKPLQLRALNSISNRQQFSYSRWLCRGRVLYRHILGAPPFSPQNFAVPDPVLRHVCRSLAHIQKSKLGSAVKLKVASRDSSCHLTTFIFREKHIAEPYRQGSALASDQVDITTTHERQKAQARKAGWAGKLAHAFLRFLLLTLEVPRAEKELIICSASLGESKGKSQALNSDLAACCSTTLLDTTTWKVHEN